MRSKVLTIGVPVAIFYKFDNTQLRDLLSIQFNNLNTSDILPAPPGLTVKVPVRLPAELADDIKQQALSRSMTIVAFTAALIGR